MADVLSTTLPHRGAAAPSLIARVTSATAVWRQRRRLATLDAHIRRDIGLTDGEVMRESNRPLWDVPDGWRF